MADPPVALTIGGQSYRVHSDADPSTLHQLARLLDARVATCNPNGRLSVTHALVYAALTLVEDLEQERAIRASNEAKTKESLHGMLRGIDMALTSTDALLPNAAKPLSQQSGQ